jgi:rhodanese-related sulfurtransferase
VAPEKRYEEIEGEELYRRLATGKPMVLLDVRTEAEFEQGHIPGSKLIPLQNLDARVREVPNSGTPITVISESGRRSINACNLLAENDCDPLFDLSGGFKNWPGPVSTGLEPGTYHQHGIAPSSFLIRNFDLLPKGMALDFVMGEGRNAIYLATRGFDVDGVDPDPQAVAQARCASRKLGVPIRAIVGNVEDGTYIIPLEAYDLIIVFNYLNRPLFKDIRDGLVPGGVVVYQAYTAEQAQFGRTSDGDALLEPGELREQFAGWEILRYRELTGASREGEMRAVAGIIARKPA